MEAEMNTDTPHWKRYSDWLFASQDRCLSLKCRSASEFGLHIARTKQSHAFSDEATPDLNFQMCVQGGLTVNHYDTGFGRTDGEVNVGDWVMAPAGARMEIEGEGDFELITISTPFQRVQRDAEMLCGTNVEDFGVLHSRLNSDSFVGQLAINLAAGERYSEIDADSAFAILVHRWLTLCGQIDSTGQSTGTLDELRLRKVLDYIHSAADQIVSLSDMAEIAGYSKYHLCRAFKASTGFSPNQYLVRLRAENAKQRIRRGASLINAALDSGFSDQPHMTRCFRRIYNTTPGHYQAEVA